MTYHTPVLLDTILEYLVQNPNGSYIDCTLGEGGHSLGILNRLEEQATLIGLDIDPVIHEFAKKKLGHFKQFKPYLANFSLLPKVLEHFQLKGVDGILADLGISMFHYKASDKGFSFHSEDPLDMTLGKTSPNAWDVVNKMSVTEISSILKTYGEEPHHYRIATFIDYYRTNIKSVDTTKELAHIISKAIISLKKESHKTIHRATKSFQAIRIYVNKELEYLESLLKHSFDALKAGGHFAVLTYHSLEDKLVKEFFLKKAKNFSLKIKTKKPIIPSKEEIEVNHAARSAKLRVYEKLG